MSRERIVLGVVVGIAVVLLLLGGFALGRFGDDDAEGAGPSAITATGTGTIKAVPDVAEVSLGVSATAANARQARSSADEQLARVLAALKGRGVKPADIQTSQITLTPNVGRNGSTVIGYTATNTVDATLRNLDTAGAIVSAAAAAGANEIGGLMLTVDDQSAVYQRALKAAVTDARAHAEAIAEAAGETVGELRAATEGSESAPLPFAEAKAADSAAPIEPGTLEITATVTATFAVD